MTRKRTPKDAPLLRVLDNPSPRRAPPEWPSSPPRSRAADDARARFWRLFLILYPLAIGAAGLAIAWLCKLAWTTLRAHVL